LSNDMVQMFRRMLRAHTFSTDGARRSDLARGLPLSAEQRDHRRSFPLQSRSHFHDLLRDRRDKHHAAPCHRPRSSTSGLCRRHRRRSPIPRHRLSGHPTAPALPRVVAIVDLAFSARISEIYSTPTLMMCVDKSLANRIGRSEIVTRIPLEVQEGLDLPRSYRKVNTGECGLLMAWVDVLDRFQGRAKKECYPGQLSECYQQLMAIAMALMTSREVVLAPDSQSVARAEEIIELLRKLNDAGTIEVQPPCAGIINMKDAHCAIRFRNGQLGSFERVMEYAPARAGS